VTQPGHCYCLKEIGALSALESTKRRRQATKKTEEGNVARKKLSKKTEGTIKQLGYPPMTDVATFHSIAHLFGKSKPRRGIYLLGFSDGLYYVGQATDVVKRFAQHRRRHDDIVWFSFQKCRKNQLDETEKRIIHQAEQKGLRLINKVHVTHVVGETDFDHLVLPEEQQKFLTDPDGFNLADSSSRIDLPQSHRDRFSKKLKRFDKHLHADRVAGVFGRYIHGCIPAYRRTEHAFWSLSCMPSTNASHHPRLACLNINTMEVFVVGREKEDGNLHWGFVNVSFDELERQYPDEIDFFRAHPGIWCSESGYRAAGSDQLTIHAYSLPVVEALIADPRIRQAAAALNLRLMRKGPTVYSKFHCIDLVDRIFPE